MNIKEAKEQIKNAITAYFTKDEFGRYVIPIQKQRPVFLVGPPGIGKTAIMEQIAAEMGVGLLSYSMTHHTRQSALGLPFIEHKNYQGQEFDISEYTMSEIIASVYDMMETTGVKEGILFLDEINCVSETLAPVMLQFLQYKVFGRHRVPDGWIVVTAGNPPEYNNSVREFDIVTRDRLKKVDCEPDFDVWKEYAYKTGVHASVLTYLEIKKADFYRVESTVDGKFFVTARGWDDLSQMIKLYEHNGITVDDKLIGQYIQSPKIAKDFTNYYNLFNKYKSDYQIDSILSGQAPASTRERAKAAAFDERLSLIGLMLDAITTDFKDVIRGDSVVKSLMATLKDYRGQIKSANPYDALEGMIGAKIDAINSGKKSGAMSFESLDVLSRELAILEEGRDVIAADTDAKTAFAHMKTAYDTNVAKVKGSAEGTRQRLTNIFDFCEEAFESGHEMLVLVTELTASYYGATFIGKYGCDAYFKHNKDLLFFERQKEIDMVLEDLDL